MQDDPKKSVETDDETTDITESAAPSEQPDETTAEPSAQAANAENIKRKKKKRTLSGAYYYLEADAETLAKKSLTRTLITIVGILLQIVVLLFLPQGGLEYITYNIPSYAYVYMWAVFVMLGVSVYVVIMNHVRYKIAKRLPKEYAPKKGFKRRVFLSTEISVAMYALILAMEITFVCIRYDIFGLIAVFICAAALAAVVCARQYTWITLRNAELIPAPEADSCRTDDAK